MDGWGDAGGDAEARTWLAMDLLAPVYALRDLESVADPGDAPAALTGLVGEHRPALTDAALAGLLDLERALVVGATLDVAGGLVDADALAMVEDVLVDEAIRLPLLPLVNAAADLVLELRREARGDEARGDEARGDEARGDEARGDEARGDEASGAGACGDEACAGEACEDWAREAEPGVGEGEPGVATGAGATWSCGTSGGRRSPGRRSLGRRSPGRCASRGAERGWTSVRRSASVARTRRTGGGGAGRSGAVTGSASCPRGPPRRRDRLLYGERRAHDGRPGQGPRSQRSR